MEIKTKLVITDWLPSDCEHGFGCGYIGVPATHPWFGKDYNSLPDVTVHRGITWAADHVGNHSPDGFWWLGFDTSHFGDDSVNCSEAYCRDQIAQLKQQAIAAIPAPAKKKNEQWMVRDENNNTTDFYNTEEEAIKSAEESLHELWRIACDRGEWPDFDQIYVAKITHELKETSNPDDTMTVDLVNCEQN
jgi:hypothetical protein